MLKYSYPGDWGVSGYKGLYYVLTYPDESNPGHLMSKGGVDTCREFYVRRFRNIINTKDGFTPWARRIYCLLSYGAPRRATFQSWNTELQEDAEKSLYITNSFEKAHKWPLTKLYPVECENAKITFVFFSGPRKWTTSPYLMSIWSLCIRLGRNDWLPANLMTLNHEDLVKQIMISARSKREGGDSDSSQVSTMKQWDTFLSFYKDLFGEESRKYHWDSARLKTNCCDRPEGIRMLLNNSTGHQELAKKYHTLKKEKKSK